MMIGWGVMIDDDVGCLSLVGTIPMLLVGTSSSRYLCINVL